MSSETRLGHQPKYWCHICNTEVPIYMAPDPTCQQCNEQFIEEVQSEDDPREFLAGGNRGEQQEHDDNTPGGGLRILPEGGTTQTRFFTFSPATGRFNDLGGGPATEMGDNIFQFFAPNAAGQPQQQRRSSNATTTDNNNDTNSNSTRAENANASPFGNFMNMLSGMLGGQIPGQDDAGRQEGADGDHAGHDHTRWHVPEGGPMFIWSNIDGNWRMQRMPGGLDGDAEGETLQATDADDNNDGEGRRREAGGGGRGITGLLQFLSAMTGAPFDGGMVGNPNDYVFSQTALDDIITQLMEQAEGGSAPPPAPEEVIEKLKKRNLTDEEKNTETDCAVCKDQFDVEEQVIELPCEHIFHSECIKPWLKLNSTCPVCRHTVLPEDAKKKDNNDRNNNENQSTSEQQQQSTSASENRTQPTASTSSSTAHRDTSAQTDSNNNQRNPVEHVGRSIAQAFQTWLGAGTSGLGNNSNEGNNGSGADGPGGSAFSWTINTGGDNAGPDQMRTMTGTGLLNREQLQAFLNNNLNRPANNSVPSQSSMSPSPSQQQQQGDSPDEQRRDGTNDATHDEPMDLDLD